LTDNRQPQLFYSLKENKLHAKIRSSILTLLYVTGFLKALFGEIMGTAFVKLDRFKLHTTTMETSILNATGQSEISSINVSLDLAGDATSYVAPVVSGSVLR